MNVVRYDVVKNKWIIENKEKTARRERYKKYIGVALEIVGTAAGIAGIIWVLFNMDFLNYVFFGF